MKARLLTLSVVVTAFLLALFNGGISTTPRCRALMLGAQGRASTSPRTPAPSTPGRLWLAMGAALSSPHARQPRFLGLNPVLAFPSSLTSESPLSAAGDGVHSVDGRSGR